MTAQLPDRIRLDGADRLLMSEPLRPLLGLLPSFVSPHTALWRGYVAEWEVVDDVLHLVGLSGHLPAGPRDTGSSGTVERHLADVFPSARPPIVATWFTGQLRVVGGEQVRHVHAGFESRYAEEVLLDVTAGRVTQTTRLTPPSALGSAGPYQLHEGLRESTGVSGGAFGEVVFGTAPDGAAVVAKVPRAKGGQGHTIVTGPGGVPVHLPATAYSWTQGAWSGTTLDRTRLTEVLEHEAEILGRDDGVLLPRSLGIWEHDRTGLPALVMERLYGVRPSTAADVRRLLLAVAGAVDRGTFEAHGDLKLEHVFVEPDGTVRVCDPAPRFREPTLRAFTPRYNPRGWTGPAADVAACATMLGFLPDARGRAWGEQVLAAAGPPGWATDHAAAAGELGRALG